MPCEGRRYSTCFHEAGHAVFRWWLGLGADDAAVIPRAAALAGANVYDRCGRPVRAEGIVNGFAIADPEMYRFHLTYPWSAEFRLPERYAARVAMALVNCFAGLAAEARHTRGSLAGCVLAGGAGDMENLRWILGAWFDGGAGARTAEIEAERIARAFVRSPKAWAAIRAVARALYERGALDGAEIADLCAVAYGGTPMHDAWALRWPPTSEQIRSGVLPQWEGSSN